MIKTNCLLIIAFLCVIFSCKNSNKTDTVSSTVAESATSDKESAQKIIDYYNVFISYYNSTSEKVNRFKNTSLPKMKSFAENKSFSDQFFTMNDFMGIVNSNTFVDGKRVDVLKPDGLLPSDVEEKIKTDVKEMTDAYDNLKDNADAYKDYLSNEDFKDDNWAKANTILSAIDQNIATYEKKSEEIFTTLQPLVDASEDVIMKDHPLREEIKWAKNVISISDEIADLVEAENINMSDLDQKYNALETAYNEGMSVDKAKLEEQKRENQFDSFLKSINDYLGVIRKAKRDGTIDQNEAEEIFRNADYVVNAYNRFVM